MVDGDGPDFQGLTYADKSTLGKRSSEVILSLLNTVSNSKVDSSAISENPVIPPFEDTDKWTEISGIVVVVIEGITPEVPRVPASL
jgi:hypothetical protein